jgi:thioredoxin-dependent peroxiredoxin
VVLGVSLDTVEGHKTWCSKDTFSFKLLADPDHKVVDMYGVPVKNFGVMKFANRETFLISPDGKVVKVWEKVDPNVHSTEVLAEIAANKK